MRLSRFTNGIVARAAFGAPQPMGRTVEVRRFLSSVSPGEAPSWFNESMNTLKKHGYVTSFLVIIGGIFVYYLYENRAVAVPAISGAAVDAIKSTFADSKDEVVVREIDQADELQQVSVSSRRIGDVSDYEGVRYVALLQDDRIALAKEFVAKHSMLLKPDELKTVVVIDARSYGEVAAKLKDFVNSHKGIEAVKDDYDDLKLKMRDVLKKRRNWVIVLKIDNDRLLDSELEGVKFTRCIDLVKDLFPEGVGSGMKGSVVLLSNRTFNLQIPGEREPREFEGIVESMPEERRDRPDDRKVASIQLMGILYYATQGEAVRLDAFKKYISVFRNHDALNRELERLIINGDLLTGDGNIKMRELTTTGYCMSPTHMWADYQQIILDLRDRMDPDTRTFEKARINKDLEQILTKQIEIFAAFQDFVSRNRGRDTHSEMNLTLAYAKLIDIVASNRLTQNYGEFEHTKHLFDLGLAAIEKQLHMHKEFSGKSIDEISIIYKDQVDNVDFKDVDKLLMYAQRLLYLKGRVYFYCKSLDMEEHRRYIERAIRIGDVVDSCSVLTSDMKQSLQSLLCKTNAELYFDLESTDAHVLIAAANKYERIKTRLETEIVGKKKLYDISKNRPESITPYTVAECEMQAVKAYMLAIQEIQRSSKKTPEMEEMLRKSRKSAAQHARSSLERVSTEDLSIGSGQVAYKKSFNRVLSFLNLLVVSLSGPTKFDELDGDFQEGLRLICAIFSFDERVILDSEASHKTVLNIASEMLENMKSKLVELDMGTSYQMAQLMEIYAISLAKRGLSLRDTRVEEAFRESLRIQTESLKRDLSDPEVKRLQRVISQYGIDSSVPESWVSRFKSSHDDFEKAGGGAGSGAAAGGGGRGRA